MDVVALCCKCFESLQPTPMDGQPQMGLSESGQDRDEHTNPVLEQHRRLTASHAAQVARAAQQGPQAQPEAALLTKTSVAPAKTSSKMAPSSLAHAPRPLARAPPPPVSVQVAAQTRTGTTATATNVASGADVPLPSTAAAAAAVSSAEPGTAVNNSVAQDMRPKGYWC